VRRKAPSPEINVTPLVDVVLVLLIIFMVVIPQLESGAAVDVPSAENIDPKSDVEYEPLTLSVTQHGELFFEREQLRREDLVNILGNAHAAAPERKLQIKGDRKVSYDTIRSVFADCQTIGFPGVGLQVGERKDDEKES
jgi:biopolymer transport protein ExbD